MVLESGGQSFRSPCLLALLWGSSRGRAAVWRGARGKHLPDQENGLLMCQGSQDGGCRLLFFRINLKSH